MNSDGSQQRAWADFALGPNGGDGALSPDKTRLALQVADGILVVGVDGQAPRIVYRGANFTGGPTWTHDGRIAFSQRVDTNGDGRVDQKDASVILIMGADGSNLVQLPGQFADVDGLAASPVSPRLALAWKIKGGQQIAGLNTDGSGLTAIGAAVLGARQPAWSPDGTRIAFSATFNIYFVNADGGDVRRAFSNAVRGGNQIEKAFQPRWALQGDVLVFVVGRGANTDVFLMKADGSAVQPLTDSPAEDSTPIWLPP